jgi:hypothetical protein
MAAIILQNIAGATPEFFRTACRSFMRLAQQAQLFAHRGGGISDLVDRAPQLFLGDTEMPGPVLHFMPLAHGDMASVALALVEEIVTHVAVLDQKDPAWGMRRGLSLPCRVRGSAEDCSFAVSLAVHEQRKKQDDRKRNSD